MTTQELIEQTILYLKDQKSYIAEHLAFQWQNVLQGITEDQKDDAAHQPTAQK